MLLNRPKNIDVARMVAEEYINANYTVKGNLTFENVNGIYIVNCDGNVEVKNAEIVKLTEGFEWGMVEGIFCCHDCNNLKSLKGSPKEVKGNFNCSYCKNLKSLEGGPKKVRGFICIYNSSLKTLEGAPKEVGGDFSCSYCINLTSLEGAPKKVVGSFYCYGCSKLKSLEGAPKRCKIYCDYINFIYYKKPKTNAIK